MKLIPILIVIFLTVLNIALADFMLISWGYSNPDEIMIGQNPLINYTAPIYCANNWVLNYTGCNLSDSKIIEYYDANKCGVVLTPAPLDNGTVLSCDYCVQDLNYSDWSNWTLDNCGEKNRTVQDLNYSTCCMLTYSYNAGADCIYYDNSTYNATYLELSTQDCRSLSQADLSTTDLYKMFFITQFIISFFILSIKLYNILHKGQAYDIKLSIVLFIAYFIFNGIGFIIQLTSYAETLIVTLFKFQTLFFVLNIVFFIIEIILLLSSNSTNVKARGINDS